MTRPHDFDAGHEQQRREQDRLAGIDPLGFDDELTEDLFHNEDRLTSRERQLLRTHAWRNAPHVSRLDNIDEAA